MADEYTTVRVKKSTRDLLNKTAESKDMSVNDLVNYFLAMKKDNTKQILLTIDAARYNSIHQLTSVLHRTKLIDKPRLEDAVMFAIQNLMQGMEKTLTSTQNFQYTPSTGYQGQ